jgi:hypothetical protein
MTALLVTTPLILGFPTQDLPTYGTIDQIKDYRRVYIACENDDSRKRIAKALGKDRELEVVGSPEQAEFFLE